MHRLLRRTATPRVIGAATCAAAAAAAVAVFQSDLRAAQEPPWGSKAAICAPLDHAKHAVGRLFQLGHGKNTQVQLPDALELIARKQLVILGEVHGNSAVVALQRQVQECMIRNTDQRLNVIMEHFSFEMQHLLDRYSAGEIDLAQV